MRWAGSWKKQDRENQKSREMIAAFLFLQEAADHFRGVTKMIPAT
jgi:hypothetical protein